MRCGSRHRMFRGKPEAGEKGEEPRGSVCLDTLMSLLSRWMVSSCVEAEVKPLRSSCSSPGKLNHLSLAWTFSSRSRLSARSRGSWPSSLFRSRSASRYSNS
ncbi:hypothetical protein EYF80_057855 [Liparis tanakae]|uniref:Uncharacterized protein n=1 Tax=Liparis tanakae TaxID=230148 RepID=A0A4Z2ESV4_9TELE|nr:hypothetical protein EYF80_057855 [Liparis tanakae]